MSPAEFAELSVNFHGAVGLYRENRWLSLVRLADVSFDAWGVRARVEPIPAHGLRSDHRGPWDISCAWPYFGASPTHWSQSYVSVRIEFDPELVNAVVAYAATLPAEFGPENYGLLRQFMDSFEDERGSGSRRTPATE